MKKKLVSVLMCAAMTAALLSGCGGSKDTPAESQSANEPAAETETKTETESNEEAASGGKTYAMITKAAGNPYNEKEAEGFKEVIEANGGTVIIQHPEAATADAQVSVIQSLISQGVDSICVAANDTNALQAALEEAMDAGIKVSSFDSSTNPASRMTFANQAGTQEIGQALMDAVYDISGGSGQWAIVSATSQATNQNAWIEAMKEIMESDSKYAELELVSVEYGDDVPEKSTTVTQALLTNYPDLKVICAPTTVGIAAAAKVLQDQGSSCKLTGLGLPSEMAAYIGDGDDFSCPYMFLWNPIDVGRLSAYISMALVNGDITGASGETFTAGDMGSYTIVEAADGGTEVILGPPFKFDPSNIAEWKDIY
ncbi:MAG: rhamnose ABC transporter substrate-binding protein [Lachnospiraceae bacterium]|nr:rhamnose ABC transporter substrate-binding protein [Lachnospiraceae bacterium]